jgi:hypothetical protein
VVTPQAHAALYFLNRRSNLNAVQCDLMGLSLNAQRWRAAHRLIHSHATTHNSVLGEPA